MMDELVYGDLMLSVALPPSLWHVAVCVRVSFARLRAPDVIPPRGVVENGKIQHCRMKKRLPDMIPTCCQFQQNSGLSSFFAACRLAN
ncbi:hypothetical protein F2P81_002795 [Scophthalmus maximus]|uniref:Uncharacterized protein n=1 Tax=Scophthalmus maximus TaxID=52904 RepID=A0A6A4TFD4_SCOMX|nr:hypothetical protein F2P81_002795 [Scophthalmus maximus]